jgi:hypothetical protein
VSEALEAPVEEAKEYIKKQPCVNADETGHKQQGNKMWMWLAATALVAVFILVTRKQRCQRVIRRIF